MKLVKLDRELDSKTTSKGQDIYPIVADITVEGIDVERANVTAWGKKALEALKEGQELDGTSREYMGRNEYTVFAPRAAGGGFKPGGGARSFKDGDAIRRQCAFKGVIELICAGKLPIENMEEALNRMDTLIKGA